MRTALVPLFVLSSLGATVSHASPQVFYVNSLTDAHDASPGDTHCDAGGGVCTLRAAVEEAYASGDAIIALPPGTIHLTLGALDVQYPLTIEGAGMDKSFVVGNDAVPVLFETGTNAITVTLTDLTLEHGASGYGGGVIWLGNTGSLTMQRVAVAHGSAAFGGCVAALGVDFTDVTMNDCHATNGAGGALYSASVGTLTRTTISGSSATGTGGGVSAFSVTLSDSTLSGNHAGGAGGGAYGASNHYPPVALYSSTVVGNSSDEAYGGGGVAAGAPIYVSDTLFGGNTDRDGTLPIGNIEESECAGAATNDGYTIMVTGGTPNCAVSGAAVIFVDDIKVGPLQNNGGYVPTRALLAGSPAIDAGDPVLCATLTTDSRGVTRVLGAACDVGAYERCPCGDVNGDGLVNASDVFFLVNYLFAGGSLPPGLADVNGDATLDVLDVFHLINALFAGGPSPSCPGT